MKESGKRISVFNISDIKVININPGRQMRVKIVLSQRNVKAGKITVGIEL